ncbi:MAG: GNAT family N-acetyltransferase [Thermoplasmatota archaeon]
MSDDIQLLVVRTKEQEFLENGIRRSVFVNEQNVSEEIEFDDHEGDSVHLLLMRSGTPIGCARYRWDGRDIKLERLALLKEERGKGYGKTIMEGILNIVLPMNPTRIYLHSQTRALEFYRRFGFEPSGETFLEAGIEHISMTYRGKEK